MTIRTEINSQGQVVSASSVALGLKMSHIAAAAAAAIMLVRTVSFVSGQNLSAPTNEFPNTIVLPGARSAEGIAIGQGSIFYASDFLAGDIFRGDLRTGKVERFIHPPNGRQAVGLKADIRHGLLFVAGGFTGHAYVYDLQTGADLATFQLGGLINDVVVTEDAAWFTDSVLPHIYRIPIAPGGKPRTIVVTGPAADLSGFPNLNGIAATPDGKTLIVSHSSLGAILTVDPTTGVSKLINGVAVPAVDGILLDGGRVYAVQVDLNQIAQIDLSPDLSSGTITAVISSPDFEAPTTAARFGDRLVAVNGKYDTGFPPTATTFEVVTVPVAGWVTIKPFNFLLSCHVRPLGHPVNVDPSKFHLIAPFESDSRKWQEKRWIDQYSGNLFYINTFGNYSSRQTARVKTYGDVISEYELHPEAKCADFDGNVCGKPTIGLLQRRHLQIELIKLVGKESNSLENVDAGTVHSAEQVYTEYSDRRRDQWQTRIVPALSKLSTSVLTKETGLSRRMIIKARQGKVRPHASNQALLISVLRKLTVI